MSIDLVPARGSRSLALKGPGRRAPAARSGRALLSGACVMASVLLAAGCAGVDLGSEVTEPEVPAPVVGQTYTFTDSNPKAYQRIFAAPDSTREVPNPDPLFVKVRAGADGAQVSLWYDPVSNYSAPYTMQAQQSATIRLVPNQSANLRPLEGGRTASVTVLSISVEPDGAS